MKKLADAQEQLLREYHRRRDLLAAAFMLETGLGPSRITFVERSTPLLSSCWVERASGRRTPRRVVLELLLRCTPWWRRRLKRRAAELHGLGLQATNTAVFAVPGQVYFAERTALQVRCRVCRKQVALRDWEAHALKAHGAIEA